MFKQSRVMRRFELTFVTLVRLNVKMFTQPNLFVKPGDRVHGDQGQLVVGHVSLHCDDQCDTVTSRGFVDVNDA